MVVKLVLVGCGNMGFAMLSGWLKSGKMKPSEVFVVEPNEALRDRAAGLGIATAASATGLRAGLKPDMVLIAVKPQVLRDVLENYKEYGSSATTFISIAAGTPIRTFEEILGSGTPVLRCMPNTPAAIGKGMMVAYANAHVTADAKAAIEDLLSASGEVTSIADEALMDAVTAVSGSGPAYIFHFIECLTKAAETVGLPSDTARLLAMQTVYGAACLAAETRQDPGELRRQVTSPNGTTAAALDVLMGGEKMQNLLTEAVHAAQKRSVELGS
ncbi:MAG: pyrroline-5-carboxylate reductase [Rhizobiaceae bacterium]|nr:pyrroline-5-carboxylate reductase [Rhizobiaceae bacterium]